MGISFADTHMNGKLWYITIVSMVTWLAFLVVTSTPLDIPNSLDCFSFWNDLIWEEFFV